MSIQLLEESTEPKINDDDSENEERYLLSRYTWDKKNNIDINGLYKAISIEREKRVENDFFDSCFCPFLFVIISFCLKSILLEVMMSISHCYIKYSNERWIKWKKKCRFNYFFPSSVWHCKIQKYIFCIIIILNRNFEINR